MTITYNHLNLPRLFTWTSGSFNGNSVEILYDAAGTKLKKTVKTGATVNYTQEYIGGIEYRDGIREAIYHAEGRVKYTSPSTTRYEYTIKDHLGNARISFSDLNGNGAVDFSTEVLQENHYYPFGLNMDGKWMNDAALDNKYQYNGKEWNDDFGLNWYNYGKRWYDVERNIWPIVDPMAHKYTSWNPYNYAIDNPILYIDPKGDTIVVNHKGYITRNDKGNNLVFLQAKNGSLTQIGELGKSIDANSIYKSLLKENMKIAKGLYSPLKFKNLVRGKGEWDLKNNMKTIYGLANHYKGSTTQFSFQGKNLTAQDMGNHHFGAVSKAYGWSDKFMLQQAGEAQIAAGTSKPEWQNYETRYVPSLKTDALIRVTESLPPYGDDPVDQSWIKAGISYFNQNNE